MSDLDERATPSQECPSCGQSNPLGFRFCGSCGTPLARVCRSCGATSPEPFRFCGVCGAPLEPATQAGVPAPLVDQAESAARDDGRVEERKVVTVLYADLAASTELATRLDPEELGRVLRPFFSAMAEEVTARGGTVEKFIGDAVVAVFGYPKAHEDDPERAVRAALAMQTRMPELGRHLSELAPRTLDLRIGVITGEVLAAQGAEHEGYVTGEAVSLAARLQSSAPIGSVVVGERTRRLTRHAIAYRSLGDLVVKGVDRPVSAWQAIPDEAPSAEPVALHSPMVGRDQELALLRALLDRTVAGGSTSLVSVVGPPGIGKSRLGVELVAAAAGSARWVRGRCLPYGAGVGYAPLAEILKADAQILDSDAPGVIEAKARARLEPQLGGPGDGLGTIEILLSTIGIAQPSDPLAGLEPAAAKRTISNAWRRYVESLCRDGPVVAVIEDIHWAEPALLDVIESLAASARGPLLIICNTRPEIWERRPSWGGGLANASSIALTRLSGDDGARLISNLLGGQPPSELVLPILERSGGNPFFVGELIRMTIEDGTLERSDDGWRLARPLPSTLPDTVQAVIASRLDLLPAAGKRIVQDAAVVGRIFWSGALGRLGSNDTLGALDDLLDKGLIAERERSSIAGQREFIFNHVLTRDVAYASIPRARRAEAHATVLAWLEHVSSGRDEEFSETLSYHASEAGDPARSARYAMLAGHRQRRVFAAEDAIGWYDRAVASLDRLTPDASSLLLVETALSRGEAYEQLGRFEMARSDYERALATARMRPQGSREWLESRALAALQLVLASEGRFDEAEAMLPEALQSARAQGADDLVGRLLCGTGTMELARGEPARALGLFDEALAMATASEDREGEAIARIGLMEVRRAVGPFADGLAQGQRAVELLRQLGQRPMVHRAERSMAMLLWLLGRPADAQRLADSATAGCREVGARADLAAALTTVALACLSQGDVGRAILAADEAVAVAHEAAAPRWELEARAGRLLVAMELDARPRIAEDIGAGLALTEVVGDRTWRRAFVAARGGLEARDGDRLTAARSFDEAAMDEAVELTSALLADRLELLAWEILDDPAGLAAVSQRLLERSAGVSPPSEAWARYGGALATLRRSGPADAADEARGAATGAAASAEVPLVWRTDRLVGQVLAAAGRDEDARTSIAAAADIVRAMLDQLDEAELARSFGSRPEVRSALGDAGADAGVRRS